MNKDKIKLWNKIRSSRGLKGEESQLAQDVFSECYDTLTASQEEEVWKLRIILADSAYVQSYEAMVQWQVKKNKVLKELYPEEKLRAYQV